MSFHIDPQPDACRALAPMPQPRPPGPPSTPLVCHMPAGHGGLHSNERRPGALSRRWEGDARPLTAAAADRGDNTARCDLCGHAPHPTSHCAFRWPGGLGCSCADRQTDEERCRDCGGSGFRQFDSDGIGACHCLIAAARPAVADADLGAAITEGVELREALARWLAWGYGGDDYADDHGSNEHWGEMADLLLALPEMRALLDSAAKVQRVEALDDGRPLIRLADFRPALGGEA